MKADSSHFHQAFIAIREKGGESEERKGEMSSRLSRIIRGLAAGGACAALVLPVAACGSDSANGSGGGSSLPQGSEQVKLDPAQFTTKIDNPYWPMTPGSRWVYTETDSAGASQRVVVTVTPKTKQIANGVEARVVSDVVSKGGTPVEVTDDYYAQDQDGNIWYLGERTAEYKHGKVATRAGSFEAGVDGAQAGIAIPANPRVGESYRQEYLKGQAEDHGEVLSTDQQVEVPFGRFQGALMTRDTTPLEPKVNELKFYAKNVGPLLELTISGGTTRTDLISYTPGS
jgi:hypothetical protein